MAAQDDIPVNVNIDNIYNKLIEYREYINDDDNIIELAKLGYNEILIITLTNGKVFEKDVLETAFHFASIYGYYECVKTLIKYVNINCVYTTYELTDNDIVEDDVCINFTALTYSSIKGYNDIVKLLLENGADVNDIGFCYAAELGHLDVVKTYLEYKVNINLTVEKRFDTIEHGYEYKTYKKMKKYCKLTMDDIMNNKIKFNDIDIGDYEYFPDVYNTDDKGFYKDDMCALDLVYKNKHYDIVDYLVQFYPGYDWYLNY